LRARGASWIIGDFTISNAAQNLNIRLAKLLAKVTSLTRATGSGFEGLSRELNFVLKNRVARNCNVF
jgi:hypothetical protein